MKNAFIFSQLRLVTWYIGLCVFGFFSVESSCNCRNNDTIDYIPPTTLDLQFTRLSYDRSNQRLVAIITNTGKDSAKDLSLRCSNISKDEKSRTAVLFNNTLTTTTLSVPSLAAGASTQEIHIPIDFQTAQEALVQMDVVYRQQVVTTENIHVNQYPIGILSIGDPVVIVKAGEMKELKWKLITDGEVDFTTIILKVDKSKGADMDVSLDGTTIGLTQLIDEATIEGVDFEKLFKQKVILVKVKNNTPDLKIIGCSLLDNGKELAKVVNILASSIEEALLPAAGSGDVKLVKQAIVDGIDINHVKNSQGATALHLAIQKSHQEIVQIFLNNGADVNAKDNDGNTALHVAAKLGRKTIVGTILTHGFDKSIKNNNNETVADVAKDQEIKDLINNWKN